MIIVIIRCGSLRAELSGPGRVERRLAGAVHISYLICQILNSCKLNIVTLIYIYIYIYSGSLRREPADGRSPGQDQRPQLINNSI